MNIAIDSVVVCGVDLKDVAERLKNGDFTTFTLPKDAAQLQSRAPIKEKEKEVENPRFLKYWTNKNVCVKLGVSRPPTNHCDFCRRSTVGRPTMGLPVAYPDINGNLPVVGTYDTWECMYSDANRELHLPKEIRDALFSDSKSVVEYLWKIQHPGKVLHYAAHPSRYEWNGGYITEEEQEKGYTPISLMTAIRPMQHQVVDVLRQELRRDK